MKKKIKKIYLQNKKRYFKKFYGTLEKPRLSIFRSNNHIYAQLINDIDKRTLINCSTLDKNYRKNLINFTAQESAFFIGGELAKRAIQKKIFYVIFDKGYNSYQGRIQNLAKGARSQGLIF